MCLLLCSSLHPVPAIVPAPGTVAAVARNKFGSDFDFDCDLDCAPPNPRVYDDLMVQQMTLLMTLMKKHDYQH